MGVYKRGRIWWLSYTLDGRQIHESSSSTFRLDAEKALAMRRAEILQGKLRRNFRVAQTSGGATLERFGEVYLRHARANKRSWRRDEQLLKHLCRSFGFRRLDEIRPLDVERYKQERCERAAPATVNRELAMLKCMFNLAIRWDYALENPCRGVKLLREDNIVERILSAQEEGRLLAAAHPLLRPIVVTALNTGLRLGEILSLAWPDVDFSRRLITVRRTKNGKIRRVPMNDYLLETLQQLGQEGGYVFTSPRTGDRRASVRTAFNAALNRAGIGKIRFHDLRHTFATRLVAAGVDIVTVKDLLGHSSIAMTMRYAHAAPERSLDAVRRLDYHKSITICTKPGQSAEAAPQGASANALVIMPLADRGARSSAG